MIEIAENGDVHYTNTRKEKSIVGNVQMDKEIWSFTPADGVHYKTLENVEVLLREHFQFPDPKPPEPPVPDVVIGGSEDDEPAMEPIPEVPIDPNAEPPQDAKLGDKTPAWMAWLKRTNPTAFAERFAGRTIPTID